jgi:hypothetical protein
MSSAMDNYSVFIFFKEGRRAVVRATSPLHTEQLRRLLCSAQSHVKNHIPRYHSTTQHCSHFSNSVWLSKQTAAVTLPAQRSL